MKKYIVELTSEERSQLHGVVDAERMAAHKRRHARMLLKADQSEHGPAWSDVQVAEAFDVKPLAVARLRQRLVERGFDQALEHGNRGSRRAKALDGKAEAHLIALACSKPPPGHKGWTFRLLAEQLVVLEQVDVDTVSHETVRQVLKKTKSSPGKKSSG